MADKVEQVEGYPSVLKDMDDDGLETVRRKVMRLMSQDMDINKISAVLIASRQLYALARLALQRELEAEGHTWADGVEEMIIKSMAEHANKPFSRTKVFEQLEGVVREFMINDIEHEVEQERSDNLHIAERIASLRDTSSVIVPSGAYKPGTTVVIVGTESEIKDYMDRVHHNAHKFWGTISSEDEKFVQDEQLDVAVVARLELASIAPSIMRRRDLRDVRIGINLWNKKGNSRAEFKDLMEDTLATTLGNRCDVLLIDDAMMAYKPKIVVTSDEFSMYGVCEVIKQTRNWAKEHKTVLVVGVIPPQEEVGSIASTLADLAERYKDLEDVSVISVPKFEEKNEN